jgi:hypothetical protein
MERQRNARMRECKPNSRCGCASARLCAARYLSSLALRSPVKSHSAARAAGTAIALPPGLRSICLPLTCVGSVERSRRETPRRAPRRRAEPDAVSSGGSEFRREEARECVQVRGIKGEPTGRFLAGNINGCRTDPWHR